MVGLQRYECPSCDKLLFKGVLVDSSIEVKCRRCGAMAEFAGVASDKLVCLMDGCPRRVTAKTLAENTAVE